MNSALASSREASDSARTAALSPDEGEGWMRRMPRLEALEEVVLSARAPLPHERERQRAAVHVVGNGDPGRFKHGGRDVEGAMAFQLRSRGNARSDRQEETAGCVRGRALVLAAEAQRAESRRVDGLPTERRVPQNGKVGQPSDEGAVKSVLQGHHL